MKRIVAGLAVIALAVGGSLLYRNLTTVPVATAKTKKLRHGVTLVVERTWYLTDRKAFSYPDTLMVTNYIPGKSEITFYYQHKSTQIVFKDFDKDHQPKCNDEDQVCTLVLPPGLTPSTPDKPVKYKYTVSGEDEKGKLKDNDPDIEVFP